MSTSVLVAKERQPGSSFGLGHKQAKNLWRKRATVAPYFEKIRRKRATVARYSMPHRFLCNVCNVVQRASQKTKKYGANAPQLHAIRCSIDFCVMLCNETAFNPVQAWLSGFAALCRSTTTVGTASIHHAQATQMFGEKASVSGLERCPGCHPERSEGSLRPASQTLRGVYTERSECAQGDRPSLQMSDVRLKLLTNSSI
jgi:hypothetical protein